MVGDFKVGSLSELRSRLEGFKSGSGDLDQFFVRTDPKIRSHGVKGDCSVLAFALVESIGYSDAGRVLGVSVLGGKLQRVLLSLQYHPVAFHFDITFEALWEEGFFEVQRKAQRDAIVCTKSVGRGSHTIAFKDGLFMGDYLPRQEFVTKVFLKRSAVSSGLEDSDDVS